MRVLDLPFDDGPIGFVEQRARVRAHHEKRHEVLEHRRAPGQQRARAARRRQRSSKLEPVFLWNLPERDGHEARQPRFGRQGVVVGAVESAVGDAVADREELSLAIEQESELGFFDEVVRELGQAHGAFDQLLRTSLRARNGRAQLMRLVAFLQHRQRRGTPRDQFRERAPGAGSSQVERELINRCRPGHKTIEIGDPLRDCDIGAFEPHGCFRDGLLLRPNSPQSALRPHAAAHPALRSDRSADRAAVASLAVVLVAAAGTAGVLTAPC